MMQIMARPCFKTSDFGCTVNFHFASLYLLSGGQFLNARYHREIIISRFVPVSSQKGVLF